MFERYLFIVNHRPHAFRDVLTSLAEAEGGVLFHCFAGKDRTGLVAAMILSLAGVPAEHIAADYGETDRQLAKQYEVWVSEAEPEKRDAFREELRCPPERILGVLAHGARVGRGPGLPRGRRDDSGEYRPRQDATGIDPGTIRGRLVELRPAEGFEPSSGSARWWVWRPSKCSPTTRISIGSRHWTRQVSNP